MREQVDHHRGEHDGHHGLGHQFVTDLHHGPHHKGSVDEEGDQADGGAEQIVEHGGNTCHTACGNVVGSGKGVDLHRVYRGPHQHEQQVQKHCFRLARLHPITPFSVYSFCASITFVKSSRRRQALPSNTASRTMPPGPCRRGSPPPGRFWAHGPHGRCGLAGPPPAPPQ